MHQWKYFNAVPEAALKQSSQQIICSEAFKFGTLPLSKSPQFIIIKMGVSSNSWPWREGVSQETVFAIKRITIAMFCRRKETNKAVSNDLNSVRVYTWIMIIVCTFPSKGAAEYSSEWYGLGWQDWTGSQEANSYREHCDSPVVVRACCFIYHKYCGRDSKAEKSSEM